MSKPTRYIAKCRCGAITSALASGQDMNRGKADPNREAPAGVYTHPEHCHAIDCRVCGQPAKARAVVGIYKPKHVCNAQCLASTSGRCECSCGGKNHGASYAAA